MAQKQITDGHPDGVTLCASTDKWSVCGKTATTRRSAPASIGASATTAILKAAINTIRNELIRKGILV
jgi:hypothetical protein